VVGADRRHVEFSKPLRRLACGNARERLRALVERHQRDDGESRDAAHGLHRVHELLEVVKGLDHEEVRAPALEHLSLLGKELAADARRRLLAERADRARDEDVLADDFPRIARELDRGRIDALELILQEVLRELAPVRAERVRLDQLGARVDEADVQRDDGVRGAEVRLLGRAQTGNGGGEQRAHPAVADDDRTGLEPLQKPVASLRLGGHFVSFRTRSTHPPGLAPGRVWHLAAEAGCRGFTGPFPQPLLMRNGTVPASRTKYRHQILREVAQSTENE
jgi:hypothetical protein